MNYRQFYEKKIGEKVPKDWHVHHINTNKKDNRIENLVAISRSLHLSYHSALGSFYCISNDFLGHFGACFLKRIGYHSKSILKAQNNHISKRKKIEKYIAIRDSKLIKNN
jgi:hypothetical protein